MNFKKLQGAGNDFILINGIKHKVYNQHDLAVKICDRHFGVGADGLMIVNDSDSADYKMTYINSDGTEGEMCGNGIRCFVKFIHDEIEKKDVYNIETLAGFYQVEMLSNDSVEGVLRVHMLMPLNDHENLPEKDYIDKALRIDDKDHFISSVILGVPHTVIYEEYDEELGKKIENNHIFPKKTNVNFIEKIEGNSITLKTWERGAGKTLACGTGACASAYISNLLGKTEKNVKVIIEGGELDIEILDEVILMTGKARNICSGFYYK